MSVYWEEIRAEVLRVARTPSFMIPTMTFPVAFYAVFALVINMGGTFPMERYLLASYGVFGVIAPSLFGLGVGFATERTAGWLRLKLASPMPITAYFLAKIVMSLLFAAVVVACLFAIAYWGGGVRQSAADWVRLAAILIVGTVPFCALGLVLGTWLSGEGAPAVANLIYLPMALLSGLWIPVRVFPEFLQSAAQIWPTYHFAQLALKVVDMDRGQSVVLHVAVLFGFLLACLGVAYVGLRRGALR